MSNDLYKMALDLCNAYVTDEWYTDYGPYDEAISTLKQRAADSIESRRKSRVRRNVAHLAKRVVNRDGVLVFEM